VKRALSPSPCSCPECAHLDLNFPGEGLQLAIPLASPPGGGGTIRQAPAPHAAIHAAAMENAHER